MIQHFFSKTDKLLALEEQYKRHQLDALTWKPVNKAPVVTGVTWLGVLGAAVYDQDLSDYRADYPYFEQYADPRKMFESAMQCADYYRFSCIGRIPTLKVQIENIVQSMFGARVFVPDNAKLKSEVFCSPVQMNLRQLLDNGKPDLQAGLLPKTLDFLTYFQNHLPEGYYIEPPPTHGPVQVLNDVLGEQLFTEFYNAPDDVKIALQWIADIIAEIILQFRSVCNYKDTVYYTGGSAKPGIQIDGDAIINLPPDMIQEFEMPAITQISKSIGEKIFYHYCPNPKDTRESYAGHPLPVIFENENILGFNSQPMGYWVYQDHFDTLKDKQIGIESHKYLPKDHTRQEFIKWIEKMHEETYGKSGIVLTLRNIISQEELNIFNDVWNKI